MCVRRLKRDGVEQTNRQETIETGRCKDQNVSNGHHGTRIDGNDSTAEVEMRAATAAWCRQAEINS
eukprot:1157426-Pelagomonas_calceolata.AAC.14